MILLFYPLLYLVYGGLIIAFLKINEGERNNDLLTALLAFNIFLIIVSGFFVASIVYVQPVASVTYAVFMVLVLLTGTALIVYEVHLRMATKISKWKYRDRIFKIHTMITLIVFIYGILTMVSFSVASVSKEEEQFDFVSNTNYSKKR